MHCHGAGFQSHTSTETRTGALLQVCPAQTNVVSSQHVKEVSTSWIDSAAGSTSRLHNCALLHDTDTRPTRKRRRWCRQPRQLLSGNPCPTYTSSYFRRFHLGRSCCMNMEVSTSAGSTYSTAAARSIYSTVSAKCKSLLQNSSVPCTPGPKEGLLTRASTKLSLPAYRELDQLHTHCCGPRL